MPFDMAPQETKVGTFQKFADAMLRGAAVTGPCTSGLMFQEGGAQACALGAMWIGLGHNLPENESEVFEALRDVRYAYERRYGCEIWRDNDRNESPLTREQIAARIAAL